MWPIESAARVGHQKNPQLHSLRKLGTEGDQWTGGMKTSLYYKEKMLASHQQSPPCNKKAPTKQDKSRSETCLTEVAGSHTEKTNSRREHFLLQGPGWVAFMQDPVRTSAGSLAKTWPRCRSQRGEEGTVGVGVTAAAAHKPQRNSFATATLAGADIFFLVEMKSGVLKLVGSSTSATSKKVGWRMGKKKVVLLQAHSASLEAPESIRSGTRPRLWGGIFTYFTPPPTPHPLAPQHPKGMPEEGTGMVSWPLSGDCVTIWRLSLRLNERQGHHTMSGPVHIPTGGVQVRDRPIGLQKQKSEAPTELTCGDMTS
uniref:uncharacterized protein LOC131103448 n=1 Tax=Doryrhamphus excisus TaxID=161450 RepID=UPI0025AE7ECA|nr:uncharacterized protein LOC131103448 [Doryrhamphus excisus]